MGSWGPKLYQDDLAEDIKEDYKELLRKGNTNKEALEKMLEKYEEEIEDSDEGPVFWMILADTMWKYGRLTNEVKEKAIEEIEKGNNLEIWKEEGTKKEYEIRKQELDKLKEKLNSQMPQEKRVPVERPIPKKRKYEWKIGDVYAYKLKSEKAKELGLEGRYFIFRKVEDVEDTSPKINIITYCQLSNTNNLPKTKDEIEELEYIIESNKGDVRYRYKIELANITQKALKEELIYIGNFKEIQELEKQYKRDIQYYPYKDIEYFVLDDLIRTGTNKKPTIYNAEPKDIEEDEIRYLMLEKYYSEILDIEVNENKEIQEEPIKYISCIDSIIIRNRLELTNKDKEKAYIKIKELRKIVENQNKNKEDKIKILDDLQKKIQEYDFISRYEFPLEKYISERIQANL